MGYSAGFIRSQLLCIVFKEDNPFSEGQGLKVTVKPV